MSSTSGKVSDRLAAITAAGTSIWLDRLRRSMIESGELARMVDEDSVRGVTSNPAIFEKAVLGSADYDAELVEGAREGLGAREIYRRLVVRDVQLAADVLRPVHEGGDGHDGFVSLQVAPRLAHDTEGILEQARRYWALVDRPNLMIRVPATPPGIRAFEQALHEGMHVDVAGIFGVRVLREVMDAYVRAMERRRADGLALDRRSVASLLVSRVDTEVDRRLEALGRPELAGRAGLANARLAYRAFSRTFGGEAFAALRAAGCPAQRLLWASTGVMNPHYPATLYVEGLVGPDTVTAMPLPTLLATAAGAEVTGPTAGADPAPDLDALREAGIDLDEVTDKLARESVDALMVPMQHLIDAIERRRREVVAERPHAIEADLPADFRGPLSERIRLAAEADVARRIWRRDPTLWAAADAPQVADRLGWLTIAEKMLDDAEALRDFAAECAADGLTDCVLLGMGGASLAPEVFRRVHGDVEGGLRLHVLDSTHPDRIAAVRDATDPANTLYVVSTKSGATVETLALFEHFRALAPGGEHFAAITDPGSALLALAQEHGFRRAFVNDPEIGGRYSALSYFGLVPAALAGVDIGAVLEAAEVAEQNCAGYVRPEANVGLWLGLALGELALRGRDKLTFVIDPPIESFGAWLEQLVAESTGKEGRGILPVADEPLADADDAYGPDRVFVHLRNDEAPDAGHDDRVRALAAAGHPTIVMGVMGAADLGRLFYFAEFATAVAGWVLGVNPFDQPDLAEAEQAGCRMLDAGAAGPDDGDLETVLGPSLAPPAYLAVTGYLPPGDEVDAAVGRLRAAVLRKRAVATTFGYGPRVLHATGQLHRGGPPTGRFLQLVEDGAGELPIPGRPHGFRALMAAQADGDLQTLRDHGLPSARVRIPAGDVVAGIDSLTTKV